jgi:hypothetical protein
MTQPSPHWDQTEWSRLTIGATVLPGVWELEGAASRNIDVKQTKGKDGAVLKDEGYENAKITLIGRLVSKDDYDALQLAIKDIHPRRKGAARDPVSINHPALTVLGIDAVYVTSIATPRLDSVGMLEQRIEVLEYTPQPKKLPKRKMTIEPPLGVGLGAVSRQLRGSVYGGPSGIEHVYTGYEPPSTDTQWAAVLDDDPLTN